MSHEGSRHGGSRRSVRTCSWTHDKKPSIRMVHVPREIQIWILRTRIRSANQYTVMASKEHKIYVVFWCDAWLSPNKNFRSVNHM
jgi:hypothetical protein